MAISTEAPPSVQSQTAKQKRAAAAAEKSKAKAKVTAAAKAAARADVADEDEAKAAAVLGPGDDDESVADTSPISGTPKASGKKSASAVSKEKKKRLKKKPKADAPADDSGDDTSPVLSTIVGGTKVPSNDRHVLQRYPIMAALATGGQAKFRTTTVWGDEVAEIRLDPENCAMVYLMIDLILDMTNIPANLSNYKAGRELTFKQFVCAHIYNLECLEDMNAKSIAGTLREVEGRIVAAAIRVGEFMRIEKQENVLADLGIDLSDLSSETVRFVLDSYKGISSITATVEDFKHIPTPNEVNIFIVKETIESLLWDNNLQFILEDGHEFAKGEHFFQNRWFARMITHRTRRTSSAHIVSNVSYNGVEAYRQLCLAYLPSEKIESLTRRLVCALDKLKLTRVCDVHTFFTVAAWYFKALNSLADKAGQLWDKKAEEAKVCDLLRTSRQFVAGTTGTNLLTALAMLQNGKKLADVKAELYRLFSEEKLEACVTNLPHGFFPEYTDVSKYEKLLTDISAGKNPPELSAKTKAAERKLRQIKRKKEEDAEKAAGAPPGDDKSSSGKARKRAKWDKRKKDA